LQRNTLMQLSKLTRLSSLQLWNGVSDSSIRPEMLGDLLAELTRLHTLKLARSQQQQEEQQFAAAAAADAAQDGAAAADAAAAQDGAPDAEAGAAADAAADAAAVTAAAQDEAQDTAEDAAADSFLERFLHRLARSLHRMQLSEVCLEGHSIGRAEAAALAKMKGLCSLELSDCDLEDCSVVDIAYGLWHTLEKLDISHNPKVTDRCLPVLARLAPSITKFQLRDTGVTEEGLQRYLPATKQH
jgi:hypothetical protein